jgi:hypothetical protein
MAVDNEYAGLQVGDLVISTERDPRYEGVSGYESTAIIEYISVSKDIIRYRSMMNNISYERSCFTFITLYELFE